MRKLTVAAIQMTSSLGHVGDNAENMRAWVERAADAGAQMAVFPECSLTGYSAPDAAEIAVAASERHAADLERYADKLGIAIAYGFVERRSATERRHTRTGRETADNLPFITYVVACGGERLVYRKAHLGASERAFFAQGDELPVAEIADVRVGVQLCWEGHIPDIATTLRAKGAELLLAPHASNLGGARRLESWQRYLPARALDNGLFVVACNALRTAANESAPDAADTGHDRRSPGHEGETGHDQRSPSRGGGLAAYDPQGKLIGSYDGADEHMLLVHVGGTLPRESSPQGMAHISYFDRRRPELYR